MVSNHFYCISNFRVTKFEIFESIQQTLVQVWDNIGKNNFTFNNGNYFFFSGNTHWFDNEIAKKRYFKLKI